MAVCLVRVGLSAAHRVCAMILWILEDDLDGPGHGEAVPRGWDRRRSSLLANYADLQGNNARAGVQDDFVCERMTMRATRPTCECESRDACFSRFGGSRIVPLPGVPGREIVLFG